MYSRPGTSALALILLCLLLLLALFPVLAGAATLASGEDPIRTDDYTVCLLSSQAVDHDTARAWRKVADEAADFARVGTQEIAAYMDGLRSSLDEPLSSHATLYRVAGENVYQPLSRFVWIRVPPGQAIHRSFGAVVHEVGHHVFDRLASRTMDDFLKRSAAADGAFEEAHDVLNPMRTLLGDLRHELEAAATDRLMARTATLGVERYLTVDLLGLERSSLDIIEPGLFKVKGLPRDPLSENMRALGWLQAAAGEVLGAADRAALDGAVARVFGRRASGRP